MTEITILVDQILLNERKIVTAGEIYYENDQSKLAGPYWLPLNVKLLWHWNRSKEFKLIPVTEYNTELHKNPHYLINGSGSSIELYQALAHIPDSSIPIIKKHKIPILIFYPLEFAVSALSEEWLLKFCDLRDQKNLQDSKIKILTLAPLIDKNYKKLNYYDLYPHERIKSIEFVESIGWLDLWNSHPLHPNHADFTNNEMFDMNRKCLEADDHKLENKFNLALCLNNRPRLNRMVLLHALYANRKYLKKIISSQRFSMRSRNLIYVLRQLCDRIAVAYPEYKNDFLVKLFNPQIHTNINFIKNKKYFDLLDDPIEKFQIQLYFLAKEFKIPGKKFLEEDSYGDLNERWNKSWYLDTWCSIITETYVDHIADVMVLKGIEVPIISEKTIKPILNHHPFIIFGHNYSNKLLKQYGFKTFDQTWFELPEEGAEGNQTFFERLYNLIESLKKLSSYSNEQLSAKWSLIKDDLIFNKKHLMNTNWPRIQKNIILGIEEENTNP